MSPASSSCQGSFEVFLNFRGEDTRNGFTGHLYEALCNKEIQTFMDADKIVKGQEISPALVTAIHNSMFSVVVLSKNYASSTWCLDELVQILRCKNAKKLTVLPIFYHVNPSDVRQQKGSFAEAFAKHEEKFKEKKGRVQIWKQALIEVANISGWDVRNKHEPTLIKEIIQHISSILIDAKAMIGVDSHLSTSESNTNKYGKSLLATAHLLASASESRKRTHFVSGRHTNEYGKSWSPMAHFLANCRHMNKYGKSLSPMAHFLVNYRRTNEYRKSLSATTHLLQNASESRNLLDTSWAHLLENARKTRNLLDTSWAHLLENASESENLLDTSWENLLDTS